MARATTKLQRTPARVTLNQTQQTSTMLCVTPLRRKSAGWVWILSTAVETEEKIFGFWQQVPW
jgi:hypothetical protein